MAFQVLGGSDGLSSPTDVALYDMFEDHDGAIWLGTSEG